ncbi:Rossmann-like and DUF2520 domain-containing protein [Crocinitomix algicola]|uniref:Rossmann-like and DUF2520 domain-containing protein n=1 Tax=Crocinitomix algicola TaxID=1740263 RepID=UPI0009F2B6FE|nr:Rossmann-like and DUF2520 domain-containing protein [Crocinitomix algicola]
MQKAIRVNIIGAGNVATHLSKALFAGGVDIVSIFSRDFINARVLSRQFGAKAVDNIQDVERNVDLNIITVKDDAIASVKNHLPKSVPVVHSSGSASIHLLEGFNDYGVLYPLQTFSKQRALDIASIPFLIEGNSIEFEQWIINFTEDYLSENAHRANTKKRGEIHLAAVFACNFTTQLLDESDSLLKSSGLDISLLHPLIKETLEKALELGPREAMTGPAKRGDNATIEKHLNQLQDEELKTIYQLLSSRIIANF